MHDEHFQKLVDHLHGLPIAGLEAVYNGAWRKAHNGIQTDANNAVLAAVEFVAGLRGILITGRGGAWEFFGE